MARTKKATSGEGGNHLTIHRYEDGTVDMKWNWEALLEEVRAATTGVDALVAVTEEKVIKTRTRKTKEKVNGNK